MNQIFEAYNCKICAHLLKDDQKHNQLALCKGLQEQAKKKRDFHSKSELEMKAGFMVVPQEQTNSDPNGRMIVLPSKMVEADEVRLQEHVVCLLEQ